MGAWGHGSFENDDAMDWAGSVIDAAPGHGTEDEPGRVSLIVGPLALLEQVDYIEAPDASVALAAAETLAAAWGAPGEAMTADEDGTLGELLAAAKSSGTELTAGKSELKTLAMSILDRINTKSELAELWDDAGGDEWHAAVAELRKRLASV